MIKSELFVVQVEMASAESTEKPKTNIFLEEFMSVDWQMRCFSTNLNRKKKKKV